MPAISKITITAEDPKSPNAGYRATWRDRESFGGTAGAALDAIKQQMPPTESASLVLIQDLKPDEFFSASQQRRLRELLDLRCEALSSGKEMSPAEKSELDDLIAMELEGSARRAAAMANEMGL